VADIPLVHLSKALSGIGNDPRLISVTAGENCPRDAGKLINERDCQHLAVKPLRCLLDPGPQSLPCRPWPPLEDNVCSLHEVSSRICFRAWISSPGWCGVPVIRFENQALIGFLHAFPSADALLQQWETCY